MAEGQRRTGVVVEGQKGKWLKDRRRVGELGVFLEVRVGEGQSEVVEGQRGRVELRAVEVAEGQRS